MKEREKGGTINHEGEETATKLDLKFKFAGYNVLK